MEARAIIDRGEPLIAPDLITAELTNVAWRRFLKGDIGLRQALLIPLEVPGVFAELFALAPLAVRALEIAAELRHPAYDCFYLALAESEDAPLVTAAAPDRATRGQSLGGPMPAPRVLSGSTPIARAVRRPDHRAAAG